MSGRKLRVTGQAESGHNLAAGLDRHHVRMQAPPTDMPDLQPAGILNGVPLVAGV